MWLHLIECYDVVDEFHTGPRERGRRGRGGKRGEGEEGGGGRGGRGKRGGGVEKGVDIEG